MAAARWDAYVMRAVLTGYAAGVICWLVLGLLPSLLAVVPSMTPSCGWR